MSTVVLSEFKRNIISFFDELIEMFPNVGEFVMIRILLKDQLPIVEVMNHFISNVLPEKNTIKTRDDSIILEKDIFFPKSRTLEFKGLRSVWSSLDDEDKDTIWRWLDSFVFLCEKYQNAMKNEKCK
jgi:hypothetical protein